MSFGQCQAEELYVRVATGEYFFGIDYIRSGHTDKDLFHELAYGTVVHEEEWLKNHLPKEESNEQTNVQSSRTALRNEGDMPVRPDRSAPRGALSEQAQPKREVRYMCSLIFAGVVFTLLWLLYY
jgi:hypothetical protein